MLSSMEFARESVDEQMQADPQQFDANFVCGPKPLVMALKYLRYACVGGWSAQTVTTVVLGFLPTLQQRALRKREKLNARGTIWLPTIMPALRALEVEIQSHTELSLTVSPLLSKILQGAGEDLGNFICIFIAALQKIPFSVQQKVVMPATESMLANHSDLVVNLFASDALSAGPKANVMEPSRSVLTRNDLKNGMKVHFKCMGIQNSKAQNLRVRQDGHVEGNGLFGARATWIVGVVGDHDGAPVVTLCADVKDQSCYLHLSEDGTVDGSGAGGSNCEFLVLSQGGSCIGLQSRSKPLLKVRIAETDTNTAEQFHFTMLLAAPVEQKIIKSIAGRFAKQIKLHDGNLKMQNSGSAEASGQDDSLPRISSSDLKDGLQVHFRCMSMQDKKSRNLRVGEDGCLEGCGGCGPRATWTVGIVGQHEDAPVVTLCVNVRGQVSYLRVAEDRKKIDGQGTGDSSCHFIVRTHDQSCVELHWLTTPSVKVRIGVSGQALEPDTTCEDTQQVRFTILSGAHSEKAAWRQVVPGEGLGKIKQAIGGAPPLPKLKLTPEEIQNGMKVHVCCLGRSGSENRNLRVRSDGDVEGRGGFGVRATWTVHAVDQRRGVVVLALQAHIDGQSWYLRATDSGTKIDGCGTGGPDCLFSACVSGQDRTVGLHSVMWPAAKVTIGTCGKLLDPLSETACDNQAFTLLRACNAAKAGQLAGKIQQAPSRTHASTSLISNVEKIRDGMKVHLMSLGRNSSCNRNLRVGPDGDVAGCGAFGVRATWIVGIIGEHRGAVAVTLQTHIEGKSSYLRAADGGTRIDGRGTGNSDCHFVMTISGAEDGIVGLHSVLWPGASVIVGSSGRLLDPLSAATCDNKSFKMLRASSCASAAEASSVPQPAGSAQVLGSSAASCEGDKVLAPSSLKDGLRVHLRCMGMQYKKARNLRVAEDGGLEGHGGYGPRATWTVGFVCNHEAAPVVTLCVHIRGQKSYLRVAEDGKHFDGWGVGDSSCLFIVTSQGNSCVGLRWLSRPSVSVGVGSSGQALDPCTDHGVDASAQFSFTLLSAVPQHPAHTMVHVARSIGQAQVGSKLFDRRTQTSSLQGIHLEELPIKPNQTSGPLVHSTPNKKLEVLTAHTLGDDMRVHLQCNGRCGAQRQNLRLCANGDVEGLGMLGNPATWTLRTVGKHNGSPIVTLHSELQGVPHFLRATKQGQKIDGRGHGGVDCQFMVKTLHVHSSVGLHPVVSPLARLGVSADGKLLDAFAPETDLHFSFSLLLHSDSSDWQLVEETTIPAGIIADQPTKAMDEAVQQEWSVMDSKEGQSGDDW